MNAARDVFIMMDKLYPQLTKEEILPPSRRGRGPEVLDLLRQPEPVGPHGAQQAERRSPSSTRTRARWTCPSGAFPGQLWRRGSLVGPRREAAIAQALANKLEQRAKDRAEAAAKARAENEAFTKEFLNKAREVFELIDKDDSGSSRSTRSRRPPVGRGRRDFLKTCGDETLMFLLQLKRLDHALRELDGRRGGRHRQCTATGLIKATEAHRLIRAQGRRRSAGACRRPRAAVDERERRERAAAAEDEAFRPNSCSPRARSS